MFEILYIYILYILYQSNNILLLPSTILQYQRSSVIIAASMKYADCPVVLNYRSLCHSRSTVLNNVAYFRHNSMKAMTLPLQCTTVHPPDTKPSIALGRLPSLCPACLRLSSVHSLVLFPAIILTLQSRLYSFFQVSSESTAWTRRRYTHV